MRDAPVVAFAADGSAAFDDLERFTFEIRSAIREMERGVRLVNKPKGGSD